MVLKPVTDQSNSAVKSLVGPPTMDLRAAFDSAFPLAADTDTSGSGGSDAGSGEGGAGTAGDVGTGSAETGADAGEGDGSAVVTDPDKKRLSDEAAEWRRKLREQEESNKALADKLRLFEDKDKSELEKAVRDAAEYKQKVDTLEAKLSSIVVKMAFFETGSAAMFRNAATGLQLLDLDGITVGEDGTVDSKAIKARAEALLKEQPYLAAEGDGSGSAGTDNGEASGRPNNGKKDSSKVDYEALAKKFPALRR